MIQTVPYANPPSAIVEFPWGRVRCLIRDLLDGEHGSAFKIAEAPPAAAEVPRPDSAPSKNEPDSLFARMAVNALRLGQITDRQVLFLTVSTDSVQKQLGFIIDAALSRKGRLLLVEGPWGSGKTHVLTLLSALARDKGLAVADLVLDGYGRSLAKPIDLIDPILLSLRYPDSPTAQGVANHLHMLFSAGRVAELRRAGAQTIPQILDAVPRDAAEDLSVWEAIEGYLACATSCTVARGLLRMLLGVRVDLPRVFPFHVAERPEAFSRLLGEWAQFASLTGARGLLVILDELDADYAARAFGSQTPAERRVAFFEALARLHDAPVPLILALGSAPAGPGVPVDLDPVRQPLAVLGKRITRIAVPEIDRIDIHDLYRKLVQLYRSAYNDRLPESRWKEFDEVFDALYRKHRKHPNPVPRRFVRQAIELLDAVSANPRKRFVLSRIEPNA